MTDLSLTIAPKCDQLTADDLLGGPRTIRIRKVAGCAEPEQPVAIYFDGDDNKPWKPCKTMRRVLVWVWGKDGTAYPGRSLTLYRDPGVKFGGLEVGGLRISHMSNMDSKVVIAVTAKKGAKKPYEVLPLAVPKDTPAGPAVPITFTYIAGETRTFKSIEAWERTWIGGNGAVDKAPLDDLRQLREENGPSMGELAEAFPEAVMRVQRALAAKLDGPDDDRGDAYEQAPTSETAA